MLALCSSKKDCCSSLTTLRISAWVSATDIRTGDGDRLGHAGTGGDLRRGGGLPLPDGLGGIVANWGITQSQGYLPTKSSPNQTSQLLNSTSIPVCEKETTTEEKS